MPQSCPGPSANRPAVYPGGEKRCQERPSSRLTASSPTSSVSSDAMKSVEPMSTIPKVPYPGALRMLHVAPPSTVRSRAPEGPRAPTPTAQAPFVSVIATCSSRPRKERGSALRQWLPPSVVRTTVPCLADPPTAIPCKLSAKSTSSMNPICGSVGHVGANHPSPPRGYEGDCADLFAAVRQGKQSPCPSSVARPKRGVTIFAVSNAVCG
jgi:hypothetical protein